MHLSSFARPSQTKTKKQHPIACHPKFKSIMDRMVVRLDSPFFFTNPTGRLEGKHYQHDFLVDLWNTACKEVGEDISMYAGLSTALVASTSTRRTVNLDELQMLTDHANGKP